MDCRQIKQLNIAFVKLGEEQCEVCDKYNLHLKDHREDSNCECCFKFAKHKEKYDIAQQIYKSDSGNASANCKHLSVDLQKVIMLPHLPGYKTAIFTRRLVMFNQTFAPLGYKNDKKNNTNRPLA